MHWMVMLGVAGLIFSGSVQALIAPPLGWTFLHVFSWVPALWIFDRLRGRRSLLAGWLVGFSANGAIFYWIVPTIEQFSNLPWLLACLVLALFALVSGFYVAVFAWGFPAVRRSSAGFWPLGVAAWFCACEFLNPQLFPYYQGVAWYQQPGLFLLTALTGVPGITFLVLHWNCLVMQLVEHLRGGATAPSARRLAWNLGIGALLVAIAGFYSADRDARIADAESEAARLRVALVQGDIDVLAEQRLYRTGGADAVIGPLVRLSERVWQAEGGNIDVFVWPEGALMSPPLEHQSLRRLVEKTQAELWTGGASFERRPGGSSEHLFNVAFRIAGTASVDPEYRKMLLVPFGEYMPFEELLPILGRIQAGRLEAGNERRVFESPQVRFVFLICFEAIRAGFVREAIQHRVGLLVNLTYDAWFGRTAAPHQHLMLSAIQAAQYGVPLIRCASTGISAFVDTRGRIVDRTELFVPATLVREVKLVRLPTFYGAHGDVFAWLCVVVSSVLLARAWLRALRNRQSGGSASSACR